jgi:tetratricopeptide (TPR) repeat protein
VELCRKIDEKRLLAPALYCLGDIHLALGDLPAARAALKESVEISWEINHPYVHDISLILLGWVHQQQGDRVSAHAALEEGLAIAERVDDHWAKAFGLQTLASMHRQEGNYAESQINFERGLEASRIVGDRIMVGAVLSNLAILTNLQRKYAESGKYAEEALGIFQTVGDEIQQPFPLRMMGYAAIHADNLLRARILIQESLRGNAVLGDMPGKLACLVAFAECQLAEKESGDAVTLCALVGSQLEVNRLKLLEPDALALERTLKGARRKLGKADYEKVYKEGRSLDVDETIKGLLAEQYIQ